MPPRINNSRPLVENQPSFATHGPAQTGQEQVTKRRGGTSKNYVVSRPWVLTRCVFDCKGTLRGTHGGGPLHLRIWGAFRESLWSPRALLVYGYVHRNTDTFFSHTVARLQYHHFPNAPAVRRCGYEGLTHITARKYTSPQGGR